MGIPGCLSYKADSGLVHQPVPNEGVLAQIELGSTTTAWLVEQFGQPQAVRRPSEQLAIWQYENVSQSSKQVRVLPLLAIDLKNSHKTVFNFQIENTYVVKYWKEKP